MAQTGKKINELAAITTLSDETVLPAVYVSGGNPSTTANKVSIEQISNKITNDLSTILNSKQDKLTAGDNITIENNVISADVDALPSQTGQSGKFLTTDGTSASWEVIQMPKEMIHRYCAVGGPGYIAGINASVLPWDSNKPKKPFVFEFWFRMPPYQSVSRNTSAVLISGDSYYDIGLEVTLDSTDSSQHGNKVRMGCGLTDVNNTWNLG